MPQDSFRSAVYRSFVATCDDPKGVNLQCNKTIRKSKNGHPQKLEDDIIIKTRNPSTSSSSYHEERKDKKTDQLQNMSSYDQMMEVSKGAQKLNQVIDSWSNRTTSFEKDSKYIAKDLLKGALDLQHSLVMLGKLQEASSQYVAKSKKKHKSEPSVDSYPFGDCNEVAMDFQKPRISADGSSSSRDCYDELRDVIRESFARQNLLAKVSPHEKDFVGRKSVDMMCTDVGSSSSSQSSLMFSQSSDCSSLKGQYEKKPKGINLIAKLMGLDETPSKAMNFINYKMVEKEKVLSQRRDLLGIDLPRPRTPRFVVQKVHRERRSLEEMIETMQYKGLLDGKYGEHHSDRGSLDHVEGPPIVIMRPSYVQRLRPKEHQPNYYIDEETPVKSVQMPRKMREEFPLRDESPTQRGHLKLTKIDEKLPAARTTSKQKVTNDKKSHSSGESPARLVKKARNIQDSLSSTKIMNHPKNPSPRVQKKEMIVKTVDKVPKIKAAKPEESTKTKDAGKTTTLKLSKSTRESNVTKSRKKTAAPDKNITATSSLKSSASKKNLKKDKPDSMHSAVSVLDTPINDDLRLDLASDSGRSLIKTTTSEQITGEMMDTSYDRVSDNFEYTRSSPSEPAGPTIKEDVKDGSSTPCDSDSAKGCKIILNTKCILLSNASFLSRVEELFNISAFDPTSFPTPSELLDDSLTIECAKEILERKSMCCTRTAFPLSLQNIYTKSKLYYPSLEQLVEEICDGIEALRSYSKPFGDTVRADSTFPMLERDVLLKGDVTGAWDSSWKNEFSMEEVDVVMNDMEKLVLSEILDDLVKEFLC